MPRFGLPTGLAVTPGIRHQYTFNGLTINRAGVRFPVRRGRSRIVVDNDRDIFKLTSVTGFEDGDIRDTRDVNPGGDGEYPGNAFNSGRTIVLEGNIEAGSIRRLEEMKQAFRLAFEPLVDQPLYIHDAYQDFYDYFSDTTPLTTKYKITTGGAILDSVNLRLLPAGLTSTEMIISGGSYDSYHQLIKYHTPTTIASGDTYELVGSRLDGTNYIAFRLYPTTGAIELYRVDSNVGTVIATASGTAMAPDSDCWLEMSEDHGVVKCSYYQAHPCTGLDPVASITYSMTPSELTKFGPGTGGNVGMQFIFGSLTNAYIDEYIAEHTDNDVFVICRKSASLQGVDQQTDAVIRRPFQVTLRASSKDMLRSGSESTATRTLDAAPPTYVNESFTLEGWNPWNTTDGHFDDDTAYWNAGANITPYGVVGAPGMAISGQVAANPVAPTILSADSFRLLTSGTALNGQTVTDPTTQVAGTDTWATSGSTVSDFHGGSSAIPKAFNDTKQIVRSTSTDGTTPRYAVINTKTSDDTTVSAKMAVNPGSSFFSSTNMGLIARWTDVNNYVRAYMKNLSQIVVEQVLAGTVTVLANIVAPVPPNVSGYAWSLRLKINKAGYFRCDALTPSGGVFGTAVGNSSDLITGHGLASGKAGIYDISQETQAFVRFYDDFSFTDLGKQRLAVVARYRDRNNGIYPVVVDAQHSWSLGLSQASPITNATIPTAYLILKSLRASSKFLALRVTQTYTSGAFRTNVALVSYASGVFTVLQTPITINSDVGLSFRVVVAGNVVSAYYTPEIDNVEVLAFTYTLTGSSATTFGTGVAGEVGFIISQPIDDIDGNFIASFSGYYVQSTITNPQTVAVYNEGSYNANPTVTLVGPYAAGTTVHFTGPTGEDNGQIVIARAIASGSFITYDVSTGLAVDQTGSLAGAYIDDDTIDPYLEAGDNVAEVRGPYWVVGTSKLEVDWRGTFR